MLKHGQIQSDGQFMENRRPKIVLVGINESTLIRHSKSPPARCKADKRKDQEHPTAGCNELGIDRRLSQNRVKCFERPGVRGEKADIPHHLWEELTRKKTTADTAEHQDQGRSIRRHLLIGMH